MPGAEQTAGPRIEAIEDLPAAAIGDAVDDSAVGIGGERGRNHLRGEGIGIGGQGLRQGGEGGDVLHGPGDGVEQENSGGGDDEGASIGNEGDAQRRVAGGESLPGIVVEIDQRDHVLARVGGGGIAVVRHQQKLGIRRHRKGARLRRHVHRSVNRIVRGRHDFDAVRREVGDVEHASRFIEGDIRCVATNRNDGPEAGCNAGRRAQQSSERDQGQAIVPAHKFRVFSRYD